MTEVTIPFEVKNRWSGEIQFTAQITCAPDATPAVRLGLAVRWAVKVGANLADANLTDANLAGANLTRAYLLGMGDMRHLKTLQLERWMIGYTADTLQIGCQRHPIEDWWSFSDERIAQMDSAALEWWGRWKPVLQQIIAASPAEPTGWVDPAKSEPAQ